MRAPDRYIVVNMGPHGKVKPCRKRVYTSYGDAAKVTQRCSRSRKADNKPCFLLQGHPGAETIVGRCDKGKCGRAKDGDRMLIERCGLGKKSRRELIASRAKGGSRVRFLSPSQASKSGVDMSGLGRSRKTRKKRRR